MHRSWVPIILLPLLLGVGLASQSWVPSAVASHKMPSHSAKPRVVATVTALERRGFATIQTVDGARYEVLTGTGWWVGDTVECEHNERTRVTWEILDCRKVS